MTNSELIEALTTLKEQARYYGDNTFVWSISIDSFKFVIDSAIKALKQEPCEDATLKDIFCMGCEYKEPTTKNNLGVDCISRAEVIDVVENTTTEWLIGDVNFMYPSLIKKIKGMPSVTPQPRKGHWISTETKGVRYAFWCRYKCSLCGELSDYKNFCPNCGADMRSNTKRKGKPIEGNNESYNCKNWIP